MNPQLEKYINSKKQEQQKKYEQQRDELLMSLGLVDGSKTKVERVYSDLLLAGYRYDDALRKYYFDKEIKLPIDITEDEYQELLKYVSKEEQPVKSEINKDASENLIALNKVLKVLAIISLIIGIILTVFGLVDINYSWWNPLPFIIGILSVVSSIPLFIVRVLINGFIVIVENAECNKCN